MTTDQGMCLPNDLSIGALLHSLPDGIYVTDTERRILFWNRAAERITGWTASEVVGRTCFDNLLVHVDAQECTLCGSDRCPLHRSIVTGEPSMEAVLVFARRKSGQRVPMEVSVGPIRNQAGKVIGGIEIFRDLSEPMQDLLRAKSIQETAVRSPLPADGRVEFEVWFQPRHVVGGDFYRIEQRDPDRYVLLLADAMGHGVAGALCAMQLRSLWDDHRPQLEDPAGFLAILNEQLHSLAREAGYFATAVCASYDAARGELRCVRAGHPAPLLFRANGTVQHIGRPQAALGMIPDVRYEENVVQLEQGDTVLCFTDGAVELFNAEERQLGIEGLKALVQEQMAAGAGGSFHTAQLEEQLLRFNSQVGFLDDLTLLKLRRNA